MRIYRIRSAAAAMFVFFLSNGAWSACAKDKVLELAENGSTLKSIASKCDMTTSEVSEIINNKTDPIESSLMPSGAPLQVCGCYGFVPYGYTEFAPMCNSKAAIAAACPGVCPMGGSPWRRICG